MRSVHQEKRTTSGITLSPTTYYMDLAGNITQLVYPTNRIVNYTYNTANRPITAVDSANGITYATSPASPLSGCLSGAVCYTPQGSVYSMGIGKTSSFTGVNVNATFNNRLQPVEIKASSSAGNALDITYNFNDIVDFPGTTNHNAGHVYGIANNLNSSRSQSFTYDLLNRIVSAGTSATTGTYCWGYQYTYDAWANLLSQAGWTPTYTGCSENIMAPVTASNANQIFPPSSYDASGNTLNDGIYFYTWNAESEMHTAAGVTYTYDGDGQRVAKSGGTSKLYWYGSGGEILAETSASGTTTAEYVFFGGRRVAILPASANAQYYVEDFLGSSRVMTTNTGTVCYDADFYPYGDERPPYTDTCTQNAYKFEGKERDAETQNDDFGARYYSWRFGRWLSSDWSAVPVAVPYANLTNPQTLNLYAMVADDPETFADLDGHDGGNTCGGYEFTPCSQKASYDQIISQASQPTLEKKASPPPPPPCPVDACVTAKPPSTIETWSWNLQWYANYFLEQTVGRWYGAFANAGNANTVAAFAVTAAEMIPPIIAEGEIADTIEIVAADGTKITGYTAHGVDRAIGDGLARTPGVRAGTKPQAILDALKNPKSIKSGVDQLGRPSKTFVGQNAKVVVNPSGKIVSVNPLSGAGAR